MSDVKIHPAVDSGLKAGTAGFAGGTLKCLCSVDPVMVRVDSDVLHNHACGCSKCWKPDGAVFSVVGVVPRDKVQVTSNNDKLHVVDESATIQRHACKVCGAHLFGRIEKEHAFHGLDFIHSELSPQGGWAPPAFAAFVSSIIEQGAPVSKMGAVRDRLTALGLPPYDVLNPPLMDALASYTAKQHGVLHE